MEKMLSRVAVMVVLVAVLFAALPDVAKAEEGNKVVNFFRKILTYPFRVTKETGEVVTETTTKGVGTVVKTGEATVGVATGQFKKLKDVVVEPVKGSAETAVTAVEGSIKIPIEAATDKAEE